MMKYFNQLDSIETEIIRLGEMKKLFSVISNGAEHSSRDEIISAIQYVEGSLDDICDNLQIKYQKLFDTIKEEELKDERTN
jgi:hypothetical protein